MKIEKYLESNSITVRHFAESIGVGRQVIYAYINGRKTPSPDTMQRIIAATDGAVTPNDFYDFGDAASRQSLKRGSSGQANIVANH